MRGRAAVLFRCRCAARDVLEHRRDRHTEDLADFVQPSSTNSIGAFFIFLNLLKADTQLLSEVILAHFFRPPSAAYLIGEMSIDPVCAPGRRRPRVFHDC
jgi:hypothetical protein